jgi:general secretion pathway protein G
MHRAAKAFTLIEILIVVVILGILAAIVIPQFTRASEDAQAGNIQSQLATIRNQIEMFRVRNNGQYPFSATSLTWGSPTGTTPAARGLRGPDYLRNDPVNPRTSSSVVIAGTDHTSGTAASGWVWNNTTRQIFASYYNETTRTWTGP